NRHGNHRAWLTHKNAFAPEENTMTSKTLGSTRITTPFSRCSATGASAIISRRKRSSGHGNYSSNGGNFRHNGSTQRFTNPVQANRVSSIRKHTIIGRIYSAKPISIQKFTFSALASPTISG